jgi:hypothetical protein
MMSGRDVGQLAQRSAQLAENLSAHIKLMTDEMRRLKLAHAAVYTLLRRLASADNPPTAEEISGLLDAHDKPTSMVDLIFAAYGTLPADEASQVRVRIRLLPQNAERR